MTITREQAKAFLDTLWPCGHMSHLDNPTRTYFTALVGRVPSSIPWNEATTDDAAKLKSIAAIMRQIADHLEVTEQEATKGQEF